jgi:serine/threonine protein kinase/WD40 repeat protein
VFADFLERLEAGETLDLEQLCSAHPTLAGVLRTMHARWAAMTRAFAALSSVHEGRLEELSDARPEGGSSVSIEGLMTRLRAGSGRQVRYAIGAEIARGAMGRIVQAWDCELRREVALKIQRDDRSDSRMQRRFLEEAQIAGQLDHPGIVPIHELGLDEAGRPFFSMRLVRGQELGAVMELARAGRDGWSRTRVLHVLLRVCEAMAYAHGRGVVHRDLKPQNVMVGPFGETYVMDWGLARAEGEESEAVDSLRATIEGEDRDSPLLTRQGDVVGTPAYMAPEQAAGTLHAASRAVDVYAIGAILYQVCAGRMPYAQPGETASVEEVLGRVRAGPPASLPQDVPVELRAITERAMARDAGARYAGVAELAEDLRAFLELRVVKSYATGRFAELSKWIARNRMLSLVSGFAVIGLVAAAAVSTQAWFSAERARRQADETARRLAVELDRSEYRNARLLLDSRNSKVAEDELWRQHGEGSMPRSTYWALVDAYERTPCIATVYAPEPGNGAVCFLPGTDEVAVGCRDGRVHVLDGSSLAPRRVLGSAGPRVTELVADHGGARLFVGAADGSLTILDPVTGALERTVRAHSSELRAIAVAPDDRGFVTGGGDGRVLYWTDERPEGDELLRGEAPIWALEFDPQGRRVASGDQSGHLGLTGLADRDTRRWRLGARNLMAIAFTVDGAHLWTGSADQNLYLVDVDGEDRVRKIPSRNGTCRDIQRDLDGSMVAGGWWRIDRIDADAGASRPIALRGTWKFDVDQVARRLASMSEASLVSVFDLSTHDRQEFGGTNVGLSGDGRRIAVQVAGGVVVRSVDGSEDLSGLPLIPTGGWLTMDRTGARIAALDGRTREVGVYDVASGALRFTVPGPEHAGSNESFGFAPDGSELATVVARSIVRRIEAETGATLAEYRVDPSPVVRLRYAPDGAVLMVLGVEPPICRLISLRDGSHEDVPVGPAPSVTALSGDGRFVAIADRRGALFLFDRRSRETRELGGQTGTVWSLAFSPSDPGLLICSTRADGVTFWDVDSGEACYSWTIEDGSITQVQISADGRTMAAYSTRGVVVRDLEYFDRHIAGNLAYQLDRVRGPGAPPTAREAELRSWAAAVLARPWPRWQRR